MRCKRTFELQPPLELQSTRLVANALVETDHLLCGQESRQDLKPVARNEEVAILAHAARQLVSDVVMKLRVAPCRRYPVSGCWLVHLENHRTWVFEELVLCHGAQVGLPFN